MLSSAMRAYWSRISKADRTLMAQKRSLPVRRHPDLLPVGSRVKCVPRGLTGTVERGKYPSKYFLAVRVDGGELGHYYPPHWEIDEHTSSVDDSTVPDLVSA